MGLLLVIDTSARPFSVALGGARECLYTACCVPEAQDLSVIVTEGLRTIGQSLSDVHAIAVNIGPGALGSVRSGVSFANALAYSLGIPLYPVTAFELMGFAVAKTQGCPVLCTARASHAYAYLGLYQAGRLSFMTYGLVDELAEAVIAGIDRVAVAGNHRSYLCNLLPDSRAVDSGVGSSVAATFLHLDSLSGRQIKVFPEMAIPVTEGSALLTSSDEILR